MHWLNLAWNCSKRGHSSPCMLKVSCDVLCVCLSFGWCCTYACCQLERCRPAFFVCAARCFHRRQLAAMTKRIVLVAGATGKQASSHYTVWACARARALPFSAGHCGALFSGLLCRTGTNNHSKAFIGILSILQVFLRLEHLLRIYFCKRQLSIQAVCWWLIQIGLGEIVYCHWLATSIAGFKVCCSSRSAFLDPVALAWSIFAVN